MNPLPLSSPQATLEEEIVEKLKTLQDGKNPVILVTAESCTGGLLASRITRIPGASVVYWGGVIAYANEIKSSALNVPVSVLEAHGAVSPETAQAMAQGALDLAQRAQLQKAPPAPNPPWIVAVATTGIAGPSGGTSLKPVGLCWIGLATSDGVQITREFRGNPNETREDLQKEFSDAAFRTLLGVLNGKKNL